MRQRVSLAWELVLAALVVVAVLPIFAVRHPPIQDLPQHLAAIRVLGDYSDPTLGFSRWFEITLGRTQYLAYYEVARVLAIPLGVVRANQLLIAASIAGTPYAMRALLGALGRDRRLALFTLPLAWNAHLILGFFNFVAAIPLALVGLAVAVRLRTAFSWRRFAVLAALLLVTFYTHVVPFGFLVLGTVLVSLGEGVLPTLRRLAALGPAAAAALYWSLTAPAGQATLTAAVKKPRGLGPSPTYQSWTEALRDVTSWLTDVLHSDHDDKLLIAYFFTLIGCIALGVGRRTDDDRPTLDEALGGALARRLGLLAPLAAYAYFEMPTSYDWIWPINARFPLLALIFLIPVLPAPRRLGALAVYAAVAWISLDGSTEMRKAFVAFEREEVGELDQVIAQVPPGQKLAGLVFSPGSRHVKFSPFLHAAAWYQLERGGAVMFSFADFPQSPFRFKEADRPPRVPPRWEWMPARVDPRRDLAWFDYVLVRGGPGRIEEQQDAWQRIYAGHQWTLWRHRTAASSAPWGKPEPAP